jgi:hypothetical protein
MIGWEKNTGTLDDIQWEKNTIFLVDVPLNQSVEQSWDSKKTVTFPDGLGCFLLHQCIYIYT